MEFFKFISDWINNNPGKATGAFLGLLIGILIFTLGILKTLFIFLLVMTGFIIGKMKDDNISIFSTIRNIFRGKSDR